MDSFFNIVFTKSLLKLSTICENQQNMKSDIFILNLQKGFAKVSIKRKQMFRQYLKRLKIVLRKEKEYRIDLFDQG